MTIDATRQRIAGTPGGIAARQMRVKRYTGAHAIGDGMRSILAGAWQRRAVRAAKERIGVDLLQCTQSEVAGYYWAKHAREAYRVFQQTPGVENLKRVFPHLDALLYLVCRDD